MATKKKAAGITLIGVDHISPHPKNPRKDIGDITELADSIKASGILQNLTVVPAEAEGEYTVLIGHRRLAAAKLAGLKEVPCTIVNLSEDGQIEVMLTENMQRTDLTLLEQAQSFKQLAFDFGKSVEEISKASGFSESTVRRRLKIAEYDAEKISQLEGRQIKLSDFDDLEKVKNAKTRESLLEYIGTPSFNWRLEQAVRDETTEEKKEKWRIYLTSKGLTEKKGYESGIKCLFTKSLDCNTDEVPLEDAEFFMFQWQSVSIFKSRDTEEEEKLEKERQSERDILDARRAKLKESFEMAYKLRRKFVFAVSEIRAKNRYKEVFKAIILSCFEGYAYDFEVGDYFENSPDSKQVYEFSDVEKDFEKHEYRSLWRTAYACLGDRDGLDCFAWNGEYERNEQLEEIYDILKSMGYVMSDEEKKLLDGTSELYIKEGSK